jgi:hypothetical protein
MLRIIAGPCRWYVCLQIRVLFMLQERVVSRMFVQQNLARYVAALFAHAAIVWQSIRVLRIGGSSLL